MQTQTLRLCRGPLFAAAALAALIYSRHRTWIQAAGPQVLWPQILLPLLPLVAAFLQLRLLRRKPQPSPIQQPLVDDDSPLQQSLLDSYAWLGLCWLELLSPWFATRLGTFLPALGTFLIAADQAWTCSALFYRRSPEIPPNPDSTVTERKGILAENRPTGGVGIAFPPSSPDSTRPDGSQERILARNRPAAGAGLALPSRCPENQDFPVDAVGQGKPCPFGTDRPANEIRPPQKMGKPQARLFSKTWWIGLGLGLLVPVLSLSGLLDRHKTFTGDEPAYLLVALSLLEDQDLVMNNQYRERQYTRFGTESYRVFAHPGLDGRLYPHHNAGLPLLLVPALALGLDDPDRALLCVRGFLALLAALTVAEIALLGTALHSKSAGLWAAAIAALSVPFAFYGTQVYPEVPAALCAVMAFRRLLDPRGSFIVAGLAAGALVWLHYKFLPIAALLGLFGILRPVGWGRRLIFSALLGLPAVLFLVFVHSTYGTWSPNALQLGVQAASAQTVVLGEMDERLQRTPLNFVGYFLDQRIGLLFYAPIFLWVLPGLLRLGKASRLQTLQLLALAMTPLLLYAWVYWSMGGYGPPNRPIVPGIPFLAVLAGIGCASASGWAARRWRDVLLLPGALFTLALLLHHDALYHPMSVRSEGARNMLVTYHGPTSFDLTAWLPAYLGSSLNGLPNALAPLLALLLAGLLLRANRHPQPAPSSLHLELRAGRLGLGLVALLLVAIRLDAIARTPAQVERGAAPEGLVLAGDAWPEPDSAAWIQGGRWARLLIPLPSPGPVPVSQANGPVVLLLESLGPNRIALRSAGPIQPLQFPGPGAARLTLEDPTYLVRSDQTYLLLEVASQTGAQEPRGHRWLGVRISLPGS